MFNFIQFFLFLIMNDFSLIPFTDFELKFKVSILDLFESELTNFQYHSYLVSLQLSYSIEIFDRKILRNFENTSTDARLIISSTSK
jgi:hypothetical protein